MMSSGGFVKARMDDTAYGEDIGAGTGLRTNAQGFDAAINPRQQYGLTERDDATGLDHTWFRKHENRGGRWTSPDPYNGSMSLGNPQSLNRYSYVQGQPTNFIDPSGLFMQRRCRAEFKWIPDNEGSGGWTIVERCYLVDESLGGSHGPPIIGEAIAGGTHGDCPLTPSGFFDIDCLLRKIQKEKDLKRRAEQFEACLKREMKEMSAKLHRLMDDNLTTTISAGLFGLGKGAQGVSGGLVGGLIAWRINLRNFNNDEFEPARQAAIKKCSGEAKYHGDLNGRLKRGRVVL